MSQNPNQKKEAAEESRRRRAFYLVNIIFLSTLAIVSLLFAIFVYLSTRNQGTGGQRMFYSENQLQLIRQEASEEEKQDLLLQIRSSMEAGESTTRMLRKIFEENIVVKDGSSYSFYPVIDGVEKNPLAQGKLSRSDGEIIYSDESPAVSLRRGVLLSDSNGRIDWDRLAESGMEETVLRVGTVSGNGFKADEQFERNCRKAEEKAISTGMCIEISGPAGEEALAEAAQAVRAAAAEHDLQSSVLLRLRTVEKAADSEETQAAWTEMVRTLCGLLEEEKLEPVIGAGHSVFAAQIDLAALSSYERWLIDYEESVLFPYSFCCWEYGAEKGTDGVPGNCIRYVRILTD